MQPLRYGDTEKKIDKKSQCLGIWYVIIFEIANWKVQIENFIFPIFIFQLFHTFFGRRNITIHLEARAGQACITSAD